MEKKRRIQDIVVKKNEIKKQQVDLEFKAPLIKPTLNKNKTSLSKSSTMPEKKPANNTLLKNNKSESVVKKINKIEKNSPVPASRTIKNNEYDLLLNKKMSQNNLDLGHLNQRHGNASGHNYSVWGIAIIAALTLFFILAGRSVKTEIQIWPRQINVPTDVEFEVVLEPIKDQSGYDQVILPVQLEKEKSAISTKEAEDFASGVIVIYNEFSQNPQRLIEETRFESADGKVYKIAKGDEVSVPGYKLTADGQKLAGTAEVKVFAENPGESYNKSYADLKIMGFKGTPKYDKFYARTKDGFTGGQAGLVPDFTGIENLTEWKNEIKEELTQKAIAQIGTRIPEGFYIPANFILFSEEPEYRINQDKLVVTAQLVGLILSEKDLTQGIANVLLDIKGQYADPVILNLKDLNYNLIESDLNAGKITIRIEGSSIFSFEIRKEELTSVIKGDTKENVEALLAQDPSITKYKVKNRPFWVKKVSDDTDAIKYQIKTNN